MTAGIPGLAISNRRPPIWNILLHSATSLFSKRCYKVAIGDCCSLIGTESDIAQGDAGDVVGLGKTGREDADFVDDVVDDAVDREARAPFKDGLEASLGKLELTYIGC